MERDKIPRRIDFSGAPHYFVRVYNLRNEILFEFVYGDRITAFKQFVNFSETYDFVVMSTYKGKNFKK